MRLPHQQVLQNLPNTGRKRLLLRAATIHGQIVESLERIKRLLKQTLAIS